MSKIVELIRPEQAIKGFDVKNLSKSSLEALNRTEHEVVSYKYRDVVIFADLTTLQISGFGNLMSKNERFIIPEIFPAKSETDKTGFQRFALPMVRNINMAETMSAFYNPAYQNIDYEMSVLSGRNYVAYEFYPFDIPTPGISDNNFGGSLIAIDVGAATKARFWRTGGKAINYNASNYQLDTNVFYHEKPTPLFECDVVPYSRNYIYLYVGTTCYDYYTLRYPFNSSLPFPNETANIAADRYSPRIKMELFSEDYSAQRFESGLYKHFETTNKLPDIIYNVSNEKCLQIDLTSTGANYMEAFFFHDFFYSEHTIPNQLSLTVNDAQAFIVNGLYIQFKIDHKNTFVNCSNAITYLSNIVPK